MSPRAAVYLALPSLAILCAGIPGTEIPASTATAAAGQAARREDAPKEVNDQIRREQFDLVLPEVMRKNHVDMWIHVMREGVTDPFGAEDLGSTSGVFVFTDRGANRIERAALERRWGASFAPETWPVDWDTSSVEESKAYDIVAAPILVKQPAGAPMKTEYDYRFKGLRAFVEERDPRRIAVNFKSDLGPYPTSTRSQDGLSHTDYVLLCKELGEKYASRLVSSEYLMMDYIIRKVPTEIQLLKTLRKDEEDQVSKAFASIVPGVTKNREVGLDVFRRRGNGISQRGRTPGQENVVIRGGDIVASPSQGMYAYVLRKGEIEPPADIKRVWSDYRKIDRILMESIKAGLTPREIVRNYTVRFEKEGFIVKDEQLQLSTPREDFRAFSAGLPAGRTIVNVDCHGMGKGARKRKFENYFGPRIGSNGPEWTWDVPLPPIHHLVLEYFFYVPWPSTEYDDQYLFFWDHEQALATEHGVEYLSPTKKELYLIKQQ